MSETPRASGRRFGAVGVLVTAAKVGYRCQRAGQKVGSSVASVSGTLVSGISGVIDIAKSIIDIA